MRRIFRTAILACTALLLVVMCAAQGAGAELRVGHAQVLTLPAELVVGWNAPAALSLETGIRFESHRAYFVGPSTVRFASRTWVFIPWWLVLAGWAAVAATGWRLARRRPAPPAFPVVPAVEA